MEESGIVPAARFVVPEGGGTNSEQDTPHAQVYTAVVESHQEVADHIEYCVSVAHRSGVRWQVWRRFNMFLQLHAELSCGLEAAEVAQLPQPPKKTWLPNFAQALAEDFIGGRRHELQAYMDAILCRPKCARHVAVQALLGVEAPEPPAGVRVVPREDDHELELRPSSAEVECAPVDAYGVEIFHMESGMSHSLVRDVGDTGTQLQLARIGRLVPGQHRFTVVAVNFAGQSAPVTITVDTVHLRQARLLQAAVSKAAPLDGSAGRELGDVQQDAPSRLGVLAELAARSADLQSGQRDLAQVHGRLTALRAEVAGSTNAPPFNMRGIVAEVQNGQQRPREALAQFRVAQRSSVPQRASETRPLFAPAAAPAAPLAPESAAAAAVALPVGAARPPWLDAALRDPRASFPDAPGGCRLPPDASRACDMFTAVSLVRPQGDAARAPWAAGVVHTQGGVVAGGVHRAVLPASTVAAPQGDALVGSVPCGDSGVGAPQCGRPQPPALQRLMPPSGCTSHGLQSTGPPPLAASAAQCLASDDVRRRWAAGGCHSDAIRGGGSSGSTNHRDLGDGSVDALRWRQGAHGCASTAGVTRAPGDWPRQPERRFQGRLGGAYAPVQAEGALLSRALDPQRLLAIPVPVECGVPPCLPQPLHSARVRAEAGPPPPPDAATGAASVAATRPVPHLQSSGSTGAASSAAPSAAPPPHRLDSAVPPQAATRVPAGAAQGDVDRTGADDDEQMCVICLSAPKSHAFVPCGHRCVCTSCAADVLGQGSGSATCPICRAIVQNVLQIYT
eukprot:CAMPEP_0117546852 /NCGR_PEP_ID=MMETSP0784-20121206/46820_1 /TAXON_ID=39447 /ORGANISM="" /LENGTH=789 /DNA_ID=CAMNT_0005343735 /DNA_START=18 /DNA_END=2387 /DNA_ORIENTATION=-